MSLISAILNIKIKKIKIHLILRLWIETSIKNIFPVPFSGFRLLLYKYKYFYTAKKSHDTCLFLVSGIQQSEIKRRKKDRKNVDKEMNQVLNFSQKCSTNDLPSYQGVSRLNFIYSKSLWWDESSIVYHPIVAFY